MSISFYGQEVNLGSTNQNIVEDTIIQSSKIDEVVILSKKKFLANKITYKVSTDEIPKNATIQRALTQIPGLFKNSSSINFNGKKAMVYIDDVIDSGLQKLKSIPAELVDKVEIIPNAGAEYSESGDISVIKVYLT